MISRIIRRLRPHLRNHRKLKSILRELDLFLARVRMAAGHRLPFLIRPAPRQLTLSITGACNFRCKGCRYGRDYMVGERLTLERTLCILKDARRAGVNRVRFYGGEPLMHPDLPAMVRHTSEIGMDPYATTNGTLLAKKIDELHDAGMKWLTIGFYGIGDACDEYTQRPKAFERLCDSLEYVRTHYGDDLEMQLNYVLTRRSCSIAALEEAWRFASSFDLFFIFDLVSYSLPFFNDGEDDDLRFHPDDKDLVDRLGRRIIELKERHPDRLVQSMTLLNAIPDLLMKGRDMRIPCDAYDSIWIGPDGSVKLCDTAFPLGNVNRDPLRDILKTVKYRKACRDAFFLKCPNCTCKLDSRIRKHYPSIRKYG